MQNQGAHQRVLVTGASGFLGSALCPRLAAAGYEVHAVSRSDHPNRPGALNWWRCDLRDRDAVSRLLGEARPEIVFHLAGRTAAARELTLVPETFLDNLATSVNVLTAAATIEGCRVVLAGSLEEPAPEEAQPLPSSPYAVSKWAASTYGRMFHALFGVPVTCARIFMVYGPGQRERWKLVPSVTISLLRGEAPRLSSGTRAIDWIYIDDVVDGLMAIARVPAAAGRTVDLGTGSLTTIRDIVRILAELVGGGIEPVFGALPERPHEQQRVANAAESVRLLGWKPATSLRQGLESTVTWCRRVVAGEAGQPPVGR